MVRSATQFPWYSRGSTPWDFFFFFPPPFFSDFCCAATELYTVAEPLVYFKYLIDLKKKEKNIFFLLQVLFFLQVLSLFLYLITFFVASST